MKSQRRPPRECPVCGEDVPPRASACPHCGADERTGWNEAETYLDGVELPDENAAFDHDEFLRDEGHQPRLKPKGLALHWWLVGLTLLALLLFGVFGPIFLRN